ncbi:MAG: DNA polymerase III subunit delta [Alicyclobacillaceae bacterium]|nr:DNA polymerase III subunit delta [Alicyclobacillaceae bacterium]
MYWSPWVEEIRAGQLVPLYGISGTEPYVIRLLVEELRQACGITMPELNVSRFDLFHTPVQQVVMEARIPPFMDQRRLIVATGGGSLHGRSKVDHDVSVWEEYVADPSPESVVVVLFGDQKVDERKQWVRTIKGNGRWWVCPALRDHELAAWIRHESARLGISVDEQAVRRLVLLSGGHLELLAGELEKLSLYAPGQRLTSDDIDRVVVPFPEQDVFRWVDDLVCLRMDRALTGLENLLKQKESPIKLLMLVARQYRLMYHAAVQSQRGYSGQQIATQLGIRPFAYKVALEQSRLYTVRQIGRVLQRLAEVDADIKTGRCGDREGLLDFVLALPSLVGRDEANAAPTSIRR